MSSSGKRKRDSRSTSKSKRRNVTYDNMPRPQRMIGIPAGRMTSRGPELKSVDYAQAVAALNSTGTIAVLNAPVNGAAFYNRIGNKIQMKSLEFRGSFAKTANAPGGTWEFLRMLIIYDTQVNGAFPTVSDVITSYTPAGATSSGSMDFININNRDRFKILMDIGVQLPTNAATATQNNNLFVIDGKAETNIHRYIKLKNLTTNYKASAGGIGDISTGAILLCTYGNLAATTEAFELVFTARLRYYDQ